MLSAGHREAHLVMSALRIALTAAVDGGAASLPAWKRLLAWYSMKLVTDPIKTKGITSMFVNPIGGMVGQIIKDGKVTNWNEIKYFLIWGLGLGAPLQLADAWVYCRSTASASAANNVRRPFGTLLERAVAVFDGQVQVEPSHQTAG